MTIKFDVLNRSSGKVQFTAEIDCAEDVPRSWKLRLAVLWAIENKANLSRADLSWANLSRADLSWADLSGANMSEANMSEANMSEANMSRANLSGANLSGADLSGADLSGADLSGADLWRDRGVVSFGPVGFERRIGYAFMLNGKPHLRLGCFTGTEKEALDAISEKYGPRSSYAALVRAACRELKWQMK